MPTDTNKYRCSVFPNMWLCGCPRQYIQSHYLGFKMPGHSLQHIHYTIVQFCNMSGRSRQQVRNSKPLVSHIRSPFTVTIKCNNISCNKSSVYGTNNYNMVGFLKVSGRPRQQQKYNILHVFTISSRSRQQMNTKS